jgi:hypothetical protein
MPVTFWEAKAGTSQLRILPVNETADDGDYVVVLGSDNLPAPTEDFEIGDKVAISQSVTLDATSKKLLFHGRFRQPASLPVREQLPTPATVTRVARGVNQDISRVNVPSAFFDSDKHNGRSIRLEGTGITDAVYRIFVVESSTQAMLVGHPLAAAGGPTTVDTTQEVLGAHWLVRVLFASTEVFAFDVGLDGGSQRDIVLPDLAINVSKFGGGTHEIRYELSLVETP